MDIALRFAKASTKGRPSVGCALTDVMDDVSVIFNAAEENVNKKESKR